MDNLNNKIKPDLNIKIMGINFKNPVIAASGTFGFGREYSQFLDTGILGGIALKALTLEPREGNKPPRIAETSSGILNSVGLQNPGIEYFLQNELDNIKSYNTVIIANVAGSTISDYCGITKILSGTYVDAIELNISCPNVKEGCAAFGSTPGGVYEITSRVRDVCSKPLIVKLTPNTADIAENASAAEKAGADAISLINTILGMAIDIETRKPVLNANYGGLSGPAIKPIALRMVHQTYQAVKIPIIGMGGIMSGEDAVEFMLAGASAVMAGTANMVKPTLCKDIIYGLEKYLSEKHIDQVKNLTGKVQMN